MFGGAKSWADRKVKRKKCKVCACEFQPVSGGNVYCVPCGIETKRENHAKGQREWRKADPLRHAINKAEHDLKQYGMSLDQYFLALDRQGGACAICGTDRPAGCGKIRPLAVDHCHKTGRVRALLCFKCNGALGMVGDSQIILTSMIQYLQDYSHE